MINIDNPLSSLSFYLLLFLFKICIGIRDLCHQDNRRRVFERSEARRDSKDWCQRSSFFHWSCPCWEVCLLCVRVRVLRSPWLSPWGPTRPPSMSTSPFYYSFVFMLLFIYYLSRVFSYSLCLIYFFSFSFLKWKVRQKLGTQLAIEAPPPAAPLSEANKDSELCVIGVPDSSLPAAIGYAKKCGIPYSEGLVKNRYIHRTFIQPSDYLRRLGVSLKVLLSFFLSSPFLFLSFSFLRTKFIIIRLYCTNDGKCSLTHWRRTSREREWCWLMIV